MSVVKMSKLRLLGLSQNKQELLNALFKAGCVQITESGQAEFKSEQSATLERIDRAIEQIQSVALLSKGKPYEVKEKSELFAMTVDEFLRANESKDEVLLLTDEVEKAVGSVASAKASIIKEESTVEQLMPYKGIEIPFAQFVSTEKTDVFFGTVEKNIEADAFGEFACVKKYNEKVVEIVALKSENVGKKLNDYGFVACPFTQNVTAQELIKQSYENVKNRQSSIEDENAKICGLFPRLKLMQTYADFLRFSTEKEELSSGFETTTCTFTLDGFIPTEKEDEVKNAIYSVSDAVIIEISEPAEDDKVPTLLKNSKPLAQTEFITDMYSTPDYREVDPSKSVFFFFMVFMGIIMADVGYGVIMTVLGFVLASRVKVDNGTKKLWNVIGIGGLFAIVFGILFNSVFGASLPFYNAILPSPVPADDGSTTGLMTILLLCLLFGVIHMTVGYFYKALNSFRRKDVAGGIFDGLVWVVFFIGFVFAVFNFIIGYLMPEALATMDPQIKEFFDKMTVPGIITAVSAVVIGAVTAGRNEKGFGKFTKGFGAVYGLISLMSDILSYARLFGLMLSGMIIAQTFNDLGLGVMNGSIIGYVFGGLIMVAGHTFNVAMGVLGAYIHDSRLQYIEFFSKFYTGEGEKFTPLGSKTSYLYFTKQKD